MKKQNKIDWKKEQGRAAAARHEVVRVFRNTRAIEITLEEETIIGISDNCEDT